MNKQVLSPFDCDMCAMIEDIIKQEIEVTASDTSIRLSWAQNGSEGNDTPEAQRIEALKQAIRGRLGDRFIEFFYADGTQSVYMKYDPEEYPEEMYTRLSDPDATAGTRYCRTLLEVDAIQFRRDNVDDVLRFTGCGTVTTPRKDMRNVSIFQPGISGKWKARPGMFGNKGNERGNGIHQPPWNATLFSLLKWEIRKRYRTIGNKPRKQTPGFCRLYT